MTPSRLRRVSPGSDRCRTYPNIADSGGGYLRWLIFIVLVILQNSCVYAHMGKRSGRSNSVSSDKLSDVAVFSDLRNVLPFEPVKYSSPNVSLKYNSSSKFNPRGMGHLYYITNLFMDQIQRRDPFPKGFLVVEDNKLQVADFKKEWHTLLTYYAGVVAVTAVGLLFALLMPCVGLVFCCCRCVGRCGSRSQPFEKKRDPCKRVTLGIFLTIIAIIILFGVVCAFVTNEYMEEGTQELPSNVKNGINDTKLYLSNTVLEVKSLLIQNYKELEQVLNNILDESGVIVKNKLGEITRAVAVENLTTIVTGLTKIQDDLNGIKEITKDLQGNASQLNHGLNGVRARILEQLRQCNTKECKDVMRQYDIEGLHVEANFDELPDVTSSFNEISDLIHENITENVMRGKEKFDSIQVEIQDSVKELIPKISESIHNAGIEISKKAKNLTDVVDNANSIVTEHSSGHVSFGENIINDYARYRHYVDIGVSILLLIILLCIVLGLFYGFCGKRPDGTYGEDCCNKGTGASFLMAAVYIIFMFSTVLMVVTLVHFLIGILVEKTICEPMVSPHRSDIMDIVDELVPLDSIYPKDKKVDVNISTAIRSCHKNQSIYEVLEMDKSMNITQVIDYKKQFAIDKQVDELQSKMQLNGDIVILTPEARNQLETLADSSMTKIDFATYTEVLREKITSVNLMVLANALKETAEKLPDGQEAIAYSLRNEAMYLETTQKNLVDRMEQMARNLERRSTVLDEDMKFNQTGLHDAIYGLITEVDKAQEYLQTKGKQEVQELAGQFADEFTNHIDQYLYRVVNQTKNNVGKCWPLSQAYNATLIAVCNKVLDPFNGFWAAIGWCLVLFIPTILLSVSLSNLYKKSDPYPGPLVESVHEKKNHHRSYHETYDNQSGYVPDYSPQYGRTGQGRERYDSRSEYPSSSYGDTRFRDMAPKHWDFPNGGPPRYHSPPLATEYERPPPYYYPGPGDTK